MNNNFYTAVKNRRSIYGISKDLVVPDERIIEIVNEAVKYAPSAFNSQSGRAVILLGEQHNKLWDITKDALRKVVSEKNFPKTEEKINSFRSGYGSILFFEDESIVIGLQNKFKSYSHNFPNWSQQSSGMLQYIVWTALEVEGFGASLQHYNELIYDAVKKEWNIPDNWQLISQLPFGKPTVPAGEKEFIPLEERVKLFK